MRIAINKFIRTLSRNVFRPSSSQVTENAIKNLEYINEINRKKNMEISCDF